MHVLQVVCVNDEETRRNDLFSESVISTKPADISQTHLLLLQ